MTPEREQFADLLAAREGLVKARDAVYREFHDALHDDLGQVAQFAKVADQIGRRIKACKVLDDWQWHLVQRPHFDWATRLLRDIHAEQHWVDHQLTALAARLTPVAGSDWTRATTASGSAYMSQGFGANSYAKGVVGLERLRWAATNIETRVEEVRHPVPPGQSWCYVETSTFELWVKAGPLDVEIVARRPGPSLRDQIKACWGMDVNPRVYNPFLPYGLEERLLERIENRSGSETFTVSSYRKEKERDPAS